VVVTTGLPRHAVTDNGKARKTCGSDRTADNLMVESEDIVALASDFKSLCGH